VEKREKRRMAGMLQARLPEARLEKVVDQRRQLNLRWALETILRTVLLGLCAGCKSLAQTEELTGDFEPATRKLLKIPRRLPDTTARDTLVQQEPSEIRKANFRTVRAAKWRKALPRVGLPFHVAALDGKGTATPSWDDHYSQRKTYDDGRQAHGLVRTVTAALVSTPAKVVLDAVPIPAETNESGIFPTVFADLMRRYRNLVRLVTYDAGATCAENCRVVIEAGKDYLFRIKDERWLVVQEAVRLLGGIPKEKAAAHTEDVTSKGVRKGSPVRSVHRYVFLYSVGYVRKFWTDLPGLKTLVRVYSETIEDGKVVASESRYYASSLTADALEGRQWLELVRNHWAVENACHWTFDAIFQEDDHPWIEKDPQGVVVMMLLRRIAYNLLALFRNVTLRSEEHHDMPWRQLMRWVLVTLVGASDLQVEGLRKRKLPAVA
jgi:predicted transposase YbfD/YdcC